MKTFEVHIPYTQVLVYTVRAENEQEAIAKASSGGVVENYSLGGSLSEPKAIEISDKAELSAVNGGAE